MTTTLVQDPRGLTFMQWAQTIVADQNVAAAPYSEKDWKRWAASLYQTLPVIPDPTPYSRWQDWALAWVGTA